ncbi:MAG: lysine--tRNA ligase [Desulfurococcales archaeon]|nr:lysine--tRNA ligase [Desulfurococcales archaeon]
MTATIHWLDKLVVELEEKLRSRGKELIVINGGLSVSGIQHIGRLRGEVILGEVVRRELRRRGFRVKQLLTLYTQDPWKGKREQLNAFKDPDKARRYIGWPLIKVPDPYGCHNSWVDHFWEDFGPYLKDFSDGEIEVVTTRDLYKSRLKEFTKTVIELRDEVRRVINKYRGRKPYPPEWIPVEPVCRNCGRIDTTEAVELLEGGERIRYRCTNCGYTGIQTIEDSKLNWRIEWVGVWSVLNVDFEPYGKDHATPGGSRDSCVDLAINVFKIKPPEGVWYEWVSLRIDKRTSDMTSSGFIGITPREWLEVAHPQILRFIYLNNPPQKSIVIDMREIPRYYDLYYKAERIYYGLEEPATSEEKVMARSYELSHIGEPPSNPPSQIPYLHAAILAQIIPPEMLPDEAIKRLKKTGHLNDADKYSIKWAIELVEKAGRWAERYGPPGVKVKLPEQPPINAYRLIEDPGRLVRLAVELERLDRWDEDSLKEAMIRFGSNMTASERRRFYRDFYLAILGRPEGPRAAPLLALLPKEWVINRLKSVMLKEQGDT